MVSKRSLPAKRNTLLAPEHTPQLEILVERRRLGRTNLDVKPGQVGLANATKQENLGRFDYAHLRVPLPQDLKGTGIFTLQENGKYPEAYFLMRRSSDGYVSATGMFKAAFPWASLQDEAAERRYISGQKTTANDEVAGNVWVPPEQALDLGAEYSMQPWVQALLDPEPVNQSAGEHISGPPVYRMARATRANANGTPSLPKPDTAEPTSTRGRGRRSVSPSKIATPSRKIASPRKPRVPKGSQRGTSAKDTSNALQEAIALQDAIAETPSVLDGADEKVKVAVETEVTTAENGEETTNTKVSVEMPKGNPDLPLPENTEQMVQTAKEMVEQAQKLDGNAGTKVSGKGIGRRGKRKAEDITGADEEAQASSSARPEKKAKRMTKTEIRLIKAKSKAYIGITAAILIGTAIPFVFG